MTIEENILNIKEVVLKEVRIMKEFVSLLTYIRGADENEKKMINNQADKLKIILRRVNKELLDSLEGSYVKRPLSELEVKAAEELKKIKEKEQKKTAFKPQKSKEQMSEMDKEILKRLKKKRAKTEIKKEKKASLYIKLANILFSKFVKNIVKQKKFKTLEKDLVRSNLGYPPITYFSVIILTGIISFIIAICAFGFFMAFNITPELPVVVRSTDLFSVRLIKLFWIPIAIPLVTLLFMFLYPSLERKAAENKINQELPFATIHMAAISGSLIEPIKVFSIISATKEYPFLEREFNKLLNEINIYGYDIVTALKNLAINCPSPKLGELFNGLATTITSGGDLYDYFDKRSQSLLFEYKLEREKRTKTAETFMDIYISVVIAAPMILMLLLMMMKISGLGVSFSTSALTFLVVGGVAVVNIFFLVFLQLKGGETG